MSADARIFAIIGLTLLTSAFLIVGLWVLRRDAHREVQSAHEVLTRHLQATDALRQTLSTELHDDVLQRLYGLSLDLESRATTPLDLEVMQDRLRAIAVDIRQLAYTLHPPALTELGLGVALPMLVEEWRDRADGALALELETGRSLPAAWHIPIYRWFQEALTNAIRHAHATRIVLSVRESRDGLVCEVTDNGIGFTLDHPGVRTGLGLRSLQRRLETLGGKTTVTSTPGQGTTVRATVPWPA